MKPKKPNGFKAFDQSAPPGLAIDRGQFDRVPPKTPAQWEKRLAAKTASILYAGSTLTRCTGGRPKKPKPKGYRGHKGVRVVCVETGQEFWSTKAASIHVGLKKGAVSLAMSLGCRAGGYHWKRL